jgi:hypothetical protein
MPPPDVGGGQGVVNLSLERTSFSLTLGSSGLSRWERKVLGSVNQESRTIWQTGVYLLQG